MFEEGILGGNGIVSMPKCEATQIYLLAENPEQACPKSSKLNTSENLHRKYIYCSLLAYVRIKWKRVNRPWSFLANI